MPMHLKEYRVAQVFFFENSKMNLSWLHKNIKSCRIKNQCRLKCIITSNNDEGY